MELQVTLDARVLIFFRLVEHHMAFGYFSSRPDIIKLDIADFSRVSCILVGEVTKDKEKTFASKTFVLYDLASKRV